MTAGLARVAVATAQGIVQVDASIAADPQQNDVRRSGQLELDAVHTQGGEPRPKAVGNAAGQLRDCCRVLGRRGRRRGTHRKNAEHRCRFHRHRLLAQARDILPGMPRCGSVVLAGRPNVGKSTLLNTLVGEHLAIVSPKPQSTRVTVVGLLTKGDTQYIFTDSPGLLEPEYQLHEAMRAAALRAIDDSEVIAHLHPLGEYPAPPLATVARLERPPRAPVVNVYTKSDLVNPSRRPTV